MFCTEFIQRSYGSCKNTSEASMECKFRGFYGNHLELSEYLRCCSLAYRFFFFFSLQREKLTSNRSGTVARDGRGLGGAGRRASRSSRASRRRPSSSDGPSSSTNWSLLCLLTRACANTRAGLLRETNSSRSTRGRFRSRRCHPRRFGSSCSRLARRSRPGGGGTAFGSLPCDGRLGNGNRRLRGGRTWGGFGKAGSGGGTGKQLPGRPRHSSSGRGTAPNWFLGCGWNCVRLVLAALLSISRRHNSGGLDSFHHGFHRACKVEVLIEASLFSVF
jgi:hypothetical protein